MQTTLSPERLDYLHIAGRAEAAVSRYVNPRVVGEAIKVLGERGEAWAASVLQRDLTRRSPARPSLPWFQDGEMETLILAHKEEES